LFWTTKSSSKWRKWNGVLIESWEVRGRWVADQKEDFKGGARRKSGEKGKAGHLSVRGLETI